jgi:alkanesulfonate monooxygenase SsuD/methylene tetrahydromethanopterin reductase-like flavin-dependent oxidoreductase (luciferase family)
VVGDQEDAEYAANLWRFSADSWRNELLHELDPREVQRKAEELFSLEDVYKNWPVGENPEEHAQKMQDLLDAGAARLFIQSPSETNAGPPTSTDRRCCLGCAPRKLVADPRTF